jgi:hypothetical protein
MRWIIRRRAIAAALAGERLTPRMQVEIDRIAIQTLETAA